MKKFTYYSIVFLVAVACVMGVYYARKIPTFNGYADKFEVYFESGSFGEIKTGVNAEEFYSLNKIKGEGFFAGADFDIQAFVGDFDAELIFVETLDGEESLYFYSDKIPYSEVVCGHRVNLHIHRAKSGIKVGAPIIYGSF